MNSMTGLLVKQRWWHTVVPASVLLLLLSTFFHVTVQAQAAPGVLVQGRVIDAGKAPLAASVMEKGTANGVATAEDGSFSLRVKNEQAVLLVSATGYRTKEYPLNGKKTIEIVLEVSDKEMDQVIVVGFGTQKKVNLTGAVGMIDRKALEGRPVQNAVQALQGQVGGLNIDNTQGGALNNKAGINIRGVGTIGEGTSGNALVLIDGMEGDIYSLNPQDIESVSVLKDAAASSIYGSRAPFGVILITTRKGRAGKGEISYNNNFRFSTPIGKPRMADSYSYALYFNDASNNAGWGDFIDQARVQRIKDFIDGKITATTVPDPSNPLLWGTGYNAANDNVDYYDVFYRDNAPAQEHNLSVSGGKDNLAYYLSANYLDQDGMLRYGTDHFKRFTTTAKLNGKVNNWLSLNYSMRYIRSNFDRPAHLTDQFYEDVARQAWPTKPLFDPNGIIFDDHVLHMISGGRNTEQETWLYQQLQAVAELLPKWRLVGEVNYRTNNQFRNWNYQTIHQTAVDGVSWGSIWNPNTLVHEQAYKNNFLNINAYTDYERTFGRAHTVKLMAGFQMEDNDYREFGAERYGIIVPSLPTLNTTTGLGGDGNPSTPSVYGMYSDWSTAGVFGRVNYDYDQRYLFEANLRYDGSSRFRKDNRWGFFPSFSAGWNIANEKFFSPLAATVNMLKLRASFGSLGNQNTTNLYPTYTVMGTAAASGSWLINGLKPNIAWAPGLISTSLTWERIQSWNIGLDIGLFNNRLTGSADYFIRKTLDMVGPAPELPAILGTPVPVTNNTDLSTKGFEVELTWRDKLPAGINYSARLVLSDSRTKITRYSNPTNSLTRYREGQDMGEIWGYTTVGIAHTQKEMDDHLGSLTNGNQIAMGNNWQAGDIMYADINGDGKIDWGENTSTNPGDVQIIGNSTPRYAFGLDLNADWKGFDVRAFFQGILKRDFFQNSYYFWGLDGGRGPWFSTAFVEHMDYFRDDPDHPLGLNLDSYYPRALWGTVKNQQVQTRYLQNAAYVRLKNLQVGYSLPAAMLAKAGIQRLRVFVSGENLFTYTELSDIFDPETIGGGYGGSVYPLMKVWAFGLQLTFK